MPPSNAALQQQQRAYRYWAPIYDPIYSRILGAAHRQLAMRARSAGQAILEIGVGTGLTLPLYGSDCRVKGIDISGHMLAKAEKKVVAEGLSHVTGLHLMDARRLRFSDEAFDAVTMPFVITLLDDPEAALDESVRVLKPGGEIIVASKISAGGPLQARIEDLAAPIVRQLGWSSSFRLSRIVNWAERRGDVELSEVSPLFPAGFFKIVRMKRLPRT